MAFVVRVHYVTLCGTTGKIGENRLPSIDPAHAGWPINFTNDRVEAGNCSGLPKNLP